MKRQQQTWLKAPSHIQLYMTYYVMLEYQKTDSKNLPFFDEVEPVPRVTQAFNNAA